MNHTYTKEVIAIIERSNLSVQTVLSVDVEKTIRH